ncbi:hypothetical protein BFN67_06920 [Pseudaminobacter manganicus]|uniref:Uncharacterized protein n=2 Tax=Manganibacter manganicus TaxID=1873176 RepID=A0A1V8RL26_9HYPH|nr:hypothetical protein BFN67_06920 [Pseudaminobacter manganicus]
MTIHKARKPPFLSQASFCYETDAGTMLFGFNDAISRYCLRTEHEKERYPAKSRRFHTELIPPSTLKSRKGNRQESMVDNTGSPDQAMRNAGAKGFAFKIGALECNHLTVAMGLRCQR